MQIPGPTKGLEGRGNLYIYIPASQKILKDWWSTHHCCPGLPLSVPFLPDPCGLIEVESAGTWPKDRRDLQRFPFRRKRLSLGEELTLGMRKASPVIRRFRNLSQNYWLLGGGLQDWPAEEANVSTTRCTCGTSGVRQT